MDNKYIELIRRKAILNMTTAKEWEGKIKALVENFIGETGKQISVYDVDILKSGISVYLSQKDKEKNRFDKSRVKFLDFYCEQRKQLEFFSQNEIDALSTKWREFLAATFESFNEDYAAYLTQTDNRPQIDA